MDTPITTVTPAAPAVPAAAPEKKPPPRASEYLEQAAAEATQKRGGTVGMGDSRQLTPSDNVPKGAEEEVGSRLTKLAAARRQLDADRAAHQKERDAWKAEQADATTHAGSFKQVLEHIKGGKVIDALKALGLTQDQIDTDVYTTLAKDIMAREPGEQLTRREVEELAEAKVKAAKEADAKAAEEAEGKRATEVRQNYLKHIETAYDPAKYPAIEKFKVTGQEVLDFAAEFVDEHGEAPTPQQVLEHFEQKRRSDAGSVLGGQPPAAGAGVPRTVTQADKAGVLPSGIDESKLTMKQKWELAKFEAGILDKPPSFLQRAS